MNDITHEISSISFGVYSPKEITNMSVCSLDTVKKSGYGSVYDPRMGSIESSIQCETCKSNANKCHGHFGRIELCEPIIHPVYYRAVLSWLQLCCKKCSRLLVTKEYIKIRDWGDDLYNNILEHTKKVEACPWDDCLAENPKVKFSPIDENFTLVLENVTITMSTMDIVKIFDNIRDEDISLVGLDPSLIHPRNLIITVLPVLPPVDRPYVKADGNICDDDITNQYIDIIKTNNQLMKMYEEPQKVANFEMKKQKYINTLKFRISTTFNNSHARAKHTTNGRPIKGIKERITGKGGIVRNGVLAKRCNHTARTVIGPEPTLRLNQLAVPEMIARKLVFPERITFFNKEKIQMLVNSGKISTVVKNDGVRINIKRYRNGTYVFCGDVIHHENGTKTTVVKSKGFIIRKGDVIERDGKMITDVVPSNRPYKIEVGWIVERPLQNGDWVLLNRQPRQKIKTEYQRLIKK